MKTNRSADYDYKRIRLTLDKPTTVSMTHEQYIRFARGLKMAPRELNKLIRSVGKKLAAEPTTTCLSVAVRNHLTAMAEGGVQ